MRAGVYCRLSLDRVGAGLGVERQREDCQAVAERLGWEVVDVYTDNDLSAYSGRPRPQYRRLLEDLRSGHLEAVIAWHTDRLHRSPLELEEFITLVEETGARVETARTGALDLSTAAGRMVARILGATARHESEHRAERIARKHQQNAEAGMPHNGSRPFGYEPGGRVIRPEEAAMVREAADRVLAGDSLRSIALDFEERGIKPSRGRPWTSTGLKRILVSARISGRREVGRARARARVGTIVAEGTWPQIISPEVSDQLRAMLAEPGRRTYGGRGVHLLSGLLRCGRCGESMAGEPKRYVCGAASMHRGCRRVSIAAEPLERLVTDAVLEAVPKLNALLESEGDAGRLADALAAANRDLRDLGTLFGAGQILRSEYEGQAQGLRQRVRDLERELQRARRALGVADLPDPLRDAWPTLPVPRRRMIISYVVNTITIAPATTRGRIFDPSRVRVDWRA